ncbi:MAG: NAD(P)/FAD-dependent oxidoreductase [Solirubrobacterales bacterium]
MSEYLVVGGGVVGLWSALELASAGASVTVVERSTPGAGATRAAAGILSPTDPPEWQGPLGEFNRAAIADWPECARELEARAGAESGYSRRRELRIGDLESDFVSAASNKGAEFGFEVRVLTRDEASDLAPGAELTDACLLLEPSGSVRTEALVDALTRACRSAGVESVTAEVSRIDPAPDAVRLELADGSELAAENVLVATGAWSGAEGLLDFVPPVSPLVGDGVVLRADVDASFPLLRTEAGSIVPRDDGTVWVGTSKREAGFSTEPDSGTIQTILDRAFAICPSLREAAVERTVAGPRPMSRDGLPFVGPLGERVVLATGHGREGIIHAPLTAKAIARGMSSGDWSSIPAEFRPDAAGRRPAQTAAAG